MREDLVVTGTIVTLRRRTWRTTGRGWVQRSQVNTERGSGSAPGAKTSTSMIVKSATGSWTGSSAGSSGQTLTSGEWSLWGIISRGGRATGTAGGRCQDASWQLLLSLTLAGVETSTRSVRLATSVSYPRRMLRMKNWEDLLLLNRFQVVFSP